MVARMSDQLGRLLGGRYRLVAPIGSGASAQVFLADDVTLHRRVAVKVLHPGLAADEAFLHRFRAEARAAAALSHPNLMAVYDWGEDDGPYLVLEYLGGGSLRALLDSGTRLSPSQALVVGLDAARALDVAHRRGFVHRDIKPANLLFGEDGRLRIADFGLARALSEAGWTDHGDGLVGTARYAAPEQARGGRIDGRADVYALGLVLIEAVTGSVPLTSEGALETMMARVDTPVPVPASLGVLAPVLAEVGRPDPADRPDAAQLGRSLVTAARDMPRPEPLPLVGSAPAIGDDLEAFDDQRFGGDDITVFGAPRHDPTGVLPKVAAPRRRRWPWVLLAILLLAGIAGGGAAVWSQVRPPSGDVPEVSGATVIEARREIDAAMANVGDDLRWEVVEEEQHSEGVAAGRVIRQRPAGGNRLDDGGRITLFVSLGPPPVDVPALDGFLQEEARRLLEESGLALGRVEVLAHETVEEGRIIGWRAGDADRPLRIPKGSEIDIVVSAGPAPREVPSLAGASADDARARLEELGLTVAVNEAFDDEVPAGDVVRTDPPAGTEVKRGATVTVVVSKGPDLVAVPNVIGMDRDRAESTLEAAGFQVVSNGPRRGRVFETDPDPGTAVRRGSVVNIYLR